MASPPPFPEEQPSPLPAPYEDPSRRLANDLAAVVASAGLKVREIWRLNGEGSLATPAFWPRDLAPLFWPLLLALGLTLMVGLVSRLPGWRGGLPAAQRTAAVAPQASGRGTGSPPGIPRTRAAPDSRQAGQPGDQGDGSALPSASAEGIPEDTGSAGGPPAAPRPADPGGGSPGLPGFWPWRKGPGGEQADPAAGRPAMVEPGAGSTADPTPSALSTTLRDGSSPSDGGDGPTAAGAAASMAGSAAENAASLVPAPLIELVGVDPPFWALSVEQRPAEGLLRLRLGEGYGQLSAAERRTLAERWLARCLELGYEHLELLDPADHLLARSARVGSGMILLDSVDSAP